MECIAVECNGMDRWNAMQWSGMEWSRWMLRMDDPDPKCPRTIWFGFFGQSDNFHFSKVAHFFSFCEARSKMASTKRRVTKLAFLKMRFYCGLFNVLLCFLLRFVYCFVAYLIYQQCAIEQYIGETAEQRNKHSKNAFSKMLILWHAFFWRPFSNAPRKKKKK